MKKQISLLVAFVAMCGLAASGQPIKFSQFPAKDVNASTYVVGVNDSAPGVPKNAKYKLPFTYRASDNNIKMPSLSKGLIQVGDSGKLNIINFDTLLVHKRGVDTNIFFSVDPGNVEVNLHFTYDSVARLIMIMGYIDVQAPWELATPPLRTSIDLIGFSSFGPTGYGMACPVDLLLVAGGDGYLPMYGDIGYFSTVDVMCNPIIFTANSVLRAYLVRPVDAIDRYVVLVNLAIPRF